MYGLEPVLPSDVAKKSLLGVILILFYFKLVLSIYTFFLMSEPVNIWLIRLISVFIHATTHCHT